ncbi:MAG TPA: PilZ domain-containing protein [Candidatus Angelobacter sp.]|nr:PilZ domain-containing protein [Candidatus Angelobacter sp.]
MANQKRVRSPRFSVPNKEQVVVSTDTEKLRGTLHLLSLTGGAIRLDKRIASGTLGDVRMDTVSGTFSAAIEFLQMTTSKAQAFRFVAMGPVARKRLEDALTKMRGQGLAVEKTPLDQLRTLAKRILSGRSRR